MSDELSVNGGAGDLSATYADMLATADGLEALALNITERSAQIAAVALNPDLRDTAILSPLTAADVAVHVTQATVGPHGLIATAARLTATALTLRAAVTAYRAVDDARAAAVTGGQMVATVGVGIDLFARQVDRAVDAAVAGDLEGLRAIPGLALQDLTETLYANPWLVDGFIKDLQVGMLLLPVVIGPQGTLALSAWTLAHEGSPFPPLNLEQSTADIIALGEAFGLFADGDVHIDFLRDGDDAAADDAADAAADALAELQLAKAEKIVAPTSFADTTSGIAQLSAEGSEGTVQVFAMIGPDGARRWVVEIPGTQTFNPRAGENPVDATTDGRLMAGQQPELNEAVRAALRDAMTKAGAAPGEPVMLAGHSLGGIAAASLAADPATRKEFNITNVYTAGSPIARFDIPPDINVLAIEHTRDAVPRLDTRPNPDHPTWTTITRDADGLTLPGKAPITDTAATHGSDAYTQTAGLVDTSTDPAVTAARDSFAPFFNADPDTTLVGVYTITRDLP